MGLFGKSKKKQQQAASDAAVAEAARQQQIQAAAAAEAQRKATVAKAKRDENRQKDDDTIERIAAKRKDIEQWTRALDGHEAQKKVILAQAAKAKKENKKALMNLKLRELESLKKKQQNTENRLLQNQKQLTALEDALAQRQGVVDVQDFTQGMANIRLDKEEVADALDKAKETVDDVNEVNMIFQADAEENRADYDLDEAAAELDEYMDELAEDQAENIPAVPDAMPAMPAAPQQPVAAGSSQTEEAEIARLEGLLG